MGNQIHLLGYAPKGSKARKTIEFDSRYPADVFNSDEYIQVLVLPENAPSKDFEKYHELLSAVINQDKGAGFLSHASGELQRPEQVADIR